MEAAAEFKDGEGLPGSVEILRIIVERGELRRRDPGGDRSRGGRRVGSGAGASSAGCAATNAIVRRSERAIVESRDAGDDAPQIFGDENVAFPAAIGYVTGLIHFE